MPNATRRLQTYLRELQAIQKRASNTSFLWIFQEKLFDWLARRQMQPNEIGLVLSEIDRAFGTDFTQYEQGIYDEYNAVLRAVNEHYGEVAGDISREMEVMRTIEKVNQLQLGQFEESTVEAIKAKVKQAILEKQRMSWLENEITAVDEKAANYATAIAHTQLMRYARIGKWQKAIAADIEVFLYGGILYPTTRTFCRIHLGKRFHVNDIMQMRNGNLEPVWENCGGWRCVHDWEPDAIARKEKVVQGKPIKIKDGQKNVVMFGSEEDSRRYIYSIGLDRFRTNKDLRDYVKDITKLPVVESEIEHIANHYNELTNKQIESLVKDVRSKPDAVYYQHQQGGPRIVFEKDGHILFASPRKNRTMYFVNEEDYDKYKKNLLDYFVKITNVL